MSTKYISKILTSGKQVLVDAITSFTGIAEQIIATGSDGKIDLSLLKDYDSFDFYAGRNGNAQPNQFLRREDRIPTNEAPLVVPMDSTIYSATAGDRDQNINATWDLEITINGGSATTVVSTVGGQLSNTNSSLSVDVTEGDRITLAMVNQSETIRDPYGSIHGRRRI